MIIAVAILLVAMGLKEAAGFYQRQEWKVLWVYSSIMAGTIVLLTAVLMDVPIPSPYTIVTMLFHHLSRIVFPPI